MNLTRGEQFQTMRLDPNNKVARAH